MNNLSVLHYLGMFGFSVVLVLILKWVGLIGGLGAALGVAAILILYIVIHENITIGRVRKAAFTFLTVWIVYAFVWPFVFNVVLPSNIQYALKSTGFYISVQVARLLHRPGAQGALSRQEYCFNEERRLVGVEIETRIKELNVLAISGNPDAKAIQTILEEVKKRPGLTPVHMAEIQQNIVKMGRVGGVGVGNTIRTTTHNELARAQQNIEAETLKCLEGIAPLPKLPSQADLPDTGIGWLWVIGLFLLVGIVLLFFSSKLLSRGIGFGLIGLALLLFLTWGITGGWKTIGGIFGGEAPPSSHQDQRQVAVRDPWSESDCTFENDNTIPERSGHFCAKLKKGTPVKLMPPPGKNTEFKVTVRAKIGYFGWDQKFLLEKEVAGENDFLCSVTGARSFLIRAIDEEGTLRVLIGKPPSPAKISGKCS